MRRPVVGIRISVSVKVAGRNSLGLPLTVKGVTAVTRLELLEPLTKVRVRDSRSNPVVLRNGQLVPRLRLKTLPRQPLLKEHATSIPRHLLPLRAR